MARTVLPASLVLALWAALAAPCFAEPEPVSLAGILAGQWETDESASNVTPKKQLEFGALLLLRTTGRGVQCSHARGPGGPAFFPATPYQHSQVNQDAETYVTHTSVALAPYAVFQPMEKLTVRGRLLVGTAWATVQYEVGAGSNWGLATYPDTSSHLDTAPGFPYFGLEVEAAFEVMDKLSILGSWRWAYGTGGFDSSWFGWAISEGFYSFTEQALFVGAQYELDPVVPYLGLALNFHNGWTRLDDTLNGSDRTWLLDYRETDHFSIVVGAFKEFESGHFVAVQFSFVAEFAASISVGYTL